MTAYAGRGGRSRRGTVAFGLVLVLGVVLIVSRCAGSSSRTPPRGLPSSIPVPGGQARYAGTVPWQDATVASADAREVLVDVPNRHPGWACRLFGVRGRVVAEDARQIRIATYGYARHDAAQGCSAVGVGPTRLTIPLAGTYAGRTLVDDDNGATHRVLVIAAAAHLNPAPAGTVAEKPSWDEQSQLVFQRYLARTRDTVEWTLTSGSPAAVAAHPPTDLPEQVVQQGGTTYHVWVGTSSGKSVGQGVIDWTLAPGLAVRLWATPAVAGHDPDLDLLLKVARTVVAPTP